jgi:hypothetical protein
MTTIEKETALVRTEGKTRAVFPAIFNKILFGQINKSQHNPS